MATIISPTDVTSQHTDFEGQKPHCRSGKKVLEWLVRINLISELLYVDPDQLVQEQGKSKLTLQEI